MENFNHVHILFSYPPKTRLSDLVANMKTVSSRLIRKEFAEHLKEKKLVDAYIVPLNPFIYFCIQTGYRREPFASLGNHFDSG